MAQKPKTVGTSNTQSSLEESDLQCLRHLRFVPRVRIEGAYIGKHQSPLRGQSQEFTDYRDYSPGDEIRRIDWKVYGRTDRHIIKLSEQETVLTCYLMLDSSASMAFGGRSYEDYFGAEDVSKFDYAGRLAAALAFLIVQQGDKVGLTLFDAQVRCHLPAGGTFAHLHRLLAMLQSNRAGRKTQLIEALRQAYALLPRRGVLILISDLLDDPEDLFEALDMYRHRNFEIILFHVMHQHELELPQLTSINFIDAESGERLTSIPADIRKTYHKELKGFMDQVRTIAASRRMDYELMSTAIGPYAALEQYLGRRSQRWGC